MHIVTDEGFGSFSRYKDVSFFLLFFLLIINFFCDIIILDNWKVLQRVQCSNEFMFHSHVRFYVTQWSAVARVQSPFSEKIGEEGNFLRGGGVYCFMGAQLKSRL